MRCAILAAATLGLFGTFASRCQAQFDFSHYVTRSMDVSGVTWYEKGLIVLSAGVGLPAPGIITAQDDPTSTFLLQPYDVNNILRFNLLKTKSNTFQPSGTLTLSTPTSARSLAFAVAGADTDTTLAMTVHFSDGMVPQSPTPSTGSKALPKLKRSNVGVTVVGSDSLRRIQGIERGGSGTVFSGELPPILFARVTAVVHGFSLPAREPAIW